ncbi:hypothetical protein [Nostoc sp. ChiVER01]|uniref:hypothetical protein n=1 Tax=Nostoc sp. ChiVER01 TaxID=3075382 RepID=UPI002AD27D43|nr:hypothetical protein [Nostoc sp. ChiVER01]MDZ8227038.1 hypothetical protein [Nostoc sp. ChiVER01]
MNNEENLNISQPDPAWDYYEIWQSLHIIKNKIDAGIKLISGEEQADDVTDQKLRQILEPASEKLVGIIEQDLMDYQKDYE